MNYKFYFLVQNFTIYQTLANPCKLILKSRIFYTLFLYLHRFSMLFLSLLRDFR
ncbi:hypothetical protein HFN_1918 [Helicobacter fennelliae MRY12-0050]|uniref:Uncharacterized protein n=1 Tax=Helicobacter fennelliae MRY12-0050 TaxID=1325130 RepID=T1CWR3_9HELI|nr:hypothetical protein HFN_1918 [Helicobacter fennelliae MRY12-0050]